MSVSGLADLLEPASSRHAPDIAFADTVHVRDLYDDVTPPPSAPIIVNDPQQGTQWMTPFAFPLPSSGEDLSLATRILLLVARLRHRLRASFYELRELWTQTGGAGQDARPSVLHRVRLLWSFWQWERTDVIRAAVIGLAVFFAVATIGTAVIDTPELQAAAAGETSQVRAARTVDQHTGRVYHGRTKTVR